MVISPLLANVYLHYVIDLWVTKVVAKHLQGDMYNVRYADDCLFGFQRREDAVRFRKALTHRLAKFGLRVNEAKSQLCRFAEGNQKRLGEPRRTLRFLGFTLYNKTSRRGKYTVGCRTASKHLSAAMTRVTAWCKQHRHQKVAWQARYLNAVLRGHYHYFGVTHNYPSIHAFYRHVQWALHRFLSRGASGPGFPGRPFTPCLNGFLWKSPGCPRQSHGKAVNVCR